MASNEFTIVQGVQAILLTFGPVGVVVVLLVMRERRWRFSLLMIFLLMTAVALAVWAWGGVLRAPLS